MDNTRRIEIALFTIRITVTIFLGLWASLKFLRPEWTQNIFKGAYNITFFEVTHGLAYTFGAIQLAIVFLFAIGYKRFWTYGLMMLMSAAGVLGSVEGLMTYWNYPRNLMLTSIPTLGALIALFLLREMDNFCSVSGRKPSK